MQIHHFRSRGAPNPPSETSDPVYMLSVTSTPIKGTIGPYTGVPLLRVPWGSILGSPFEGTMGLYIRLPL